MTTLGERFKKFNIHAIMAGPLVRTRQSADIIAEIIACPVITDERLTDILISHWDGLAKEEIKRRFGSQYPDWQAHPESFCLPDCETLHQVQQRASLLLEDVFQEYQGKKIVLVSHLVVLRCLALQYKKLPLSDYRTIDIANGSICMLERAADGKTKIKDL